MRKKGQVTLFIILGILIFSAVVIFSFFKSNSAEQTREIVSAQSQIAGEKMAIESYLEACLESVAEEAIYKASLFGGFINISNVSRRFLINNSMILSGDATDNNSIYLYRDGFIPYDNASFIKEQIEHNIASYVESGNGGLNIYFNDTVYEERGIFACLDPNNDSILFDRLVDLGWNYTWEDPKVIANVSINQNSVDYILQLPNLNFFKGDIGITADKIATKSDIKLGQLINLTASIIEKSYMLDLAHSRRENIDISDIAAYSLDITLDYSFPEKKTKLTHWRITAHPEVYLGKQQMINYTFDFYTSIAGYRRCKPDVCMAQRNQCTNDSPTEVYAHSDTMLYKVDPVTNSFIGIGPLFGCWGVIDMAEDKDSNLYATTFLGLYKVNKDTGQCTFISAGLYPNSLTFVPKGVIYPDKEALVGYQMNTYVVIDQTTGAMMPRGMLPLGYMSSGDIVSVAGVGTYLTVTGMGCSDCLFLVNPSTGQMEENLGDLGFSEVYGLSFFEGEIYGFSASGDVFAYNLDEGAAVPIDVYGSSGIAFAGAGSSTCAPE